MSYHGCVYGLLDPQTMELRYVGQTTQLPVEKRLQTHLCPSSLRRHSYLARWLKGLKSKGLRPCMTVLASASSQTALDALEITMIAQARRQGARLVNLTDGGGGRHGFHPSRESIEKTASAQRGVPKPQHTPEWKAHMSALMTGRNTNTPEHMERLRQAKIGVPRPQHVCDAVAKASRGRPSPMRGTSMPSDVRAKVSASRRGKCIAQDHHAWRSDIETSVILQRLAEGATKVLIARELGVSPTFIHRRLAAHRFRESV